MSADAVALATEAVLGTARDDVTESAGAGDDFRPVFKALKSGKERRGIRLEQIYWTVLKQIARSRGLPLGRYVEEVAASLPNDANITSALRVTAVRWLSQRESELSRHTGPAVISAIVQACPTPAFALQDDKRIVAYNQAFIAYIRARFADFSSASMAKGLRLTLDVQIADLVETLRQAGNRPVRTGFMLGIEDQRLRGQLSTTLAPSPDRTVIIGYVAPG